MATEIELKYLVGTTQYVDVIEKITNLMSSKRTCSQSCSFVQRTKKLSNCYFDTPDKVLRHQDIGLRVRVCESVIEQTIKTRGKVIGGLHQRPEYNVILEDNFPNLSLFPSEIFSKSINVDKIQSDIVAIFSTDFTRTTWTITAENDSVIELAFDHGEIESNGLNTDICEVELELVQGNVDDLFNLANELFELLPLRPGIKSKAARGYALWQNDGVKALLTPLELIPLKKSITIEQSFIAGITFGLQQLQNFIAAYFETPSLSYLAKITEVLALLRHGFWLFKDKLPQSMEGVRNELSYFIKLLTWVDSAIYFQELTTKTGNYRKKIQLSEALFAQLKLEKRRFPDIEHVIELIHSPRFNQLQLSLLKVLLDDDLINSNKNTHDDKASANREELILFAQYWLDKNLTELVSLISRQKALDSELFLAQNKPLIRSLLTGSWFGDLFDKEQRLDFRNPWLDIKQGISELQTLWVLQQQLQTLDETPKKLINWQSSKVDNLLLALEQSKTMALSLTPYWRM